MRIGVVTTSYPRFPGDAAGSFVAAHVAWLRARGHDVDVVGADHGVAAPRGIFYGGGAPDAIEAGASRVALARFTLALAAEVRRRARGWDATVAHWWVPSAAVAAAAGAPRLLAIAHGGDVDVARRARVLGPVAALLVARGAKLVFVSRGLRDAALAALPAPFARKADQASIVQPMGIDVARFAAIRAARAPSATKTVALLARLVPIKGVAVAIDAMRAMRTPGARLAIAGDGPLRAELEARARGLPIDFLGALGAGARDELLRTAAVVAIPSIPIRGRAEGAPVVAREAVAAGVPVVASATGGLADLAGLTLVPPGDPGALAAALDRALADPRPPDLAAAGALDWSAVGAALDAHWAR